MTTRVLSKAGGIGIVVNGTRYVLVDGQVLDIVDADAIAGANAGAWTICATIGPLGARPSTPLMVTMSVPHIDTTNNNKPVFHDTKTWRDAMGMRA